MPKKYSNGSITFLTILELKKKHVFDFLSGWEAKNEKTAPNERMTPAKHRYITGRAVKILHNVIFCGGTKDEIERAVKFSLIALDAMKWHLDVNAAEAKYGVKELYEKYCYTATNKPDAGDN